MFLSPLFLFLSFQKPTTTFHQNSAKNLNLSPPKLPQNKIATTTEKPNHNNQNQVTTHPKIKPIAKKQKEKKKSTTTATNPTTHHHHLESINTTINRHQNHISIPTNTKKKK